MKTRMIINLLTVVSVSFFANAGKLTVQPTMSAPTCRGKSDGNIALFISGGKAPYTVLWQDGNTDLMRTGLTYGTYAYLVKDSKGYQCEGTVCLEIPEPLSVSFGGKDHLPVNGTKALTDMQVKGGRPFEDVGYILRLDGKFLTEKSVITGPEKHILEIEDASGCVLNFPVLSITERTDCYFADGYNEDLKFQGLPLVLFLIPELKDVPMNGSATFVSVSGAVTSSPY